jgi:hypothetical protein
MTRIVYNNGEIAFGISRITNLVQVYSRKDSRTSPDDFIKLLPRDEQFVAELGAAKIDQLVQDYKRQ